jgi:hypothetical protein
VGAVAFGLVCLHARHSFPFCQTVHQTTSLPATTQRRGSWHCALHGCCPGDPQTTAVSHESIRCPPWPGNCMALAPPCCCRELPRPSNLATQQPSSPATQQRRRLGGPRGAAQLEHTRRREAFSQLSGHVLLAWPAVSCPTPSQPCNLSTSGLAAACDGLLQAKQPTAADRGSLSIATARSAQLLSSPSGGWGCDLRPASGGSCPVLNNHCEPWVSPTNLNLRGCCLRLDSLSTSVPCWPLL